MQRFLITVRCLKKTKFKSFKRPGACLIHLNPFSSIPSIEPANPEPPDVCSQLFSLLSLPNWEIHPSLNNLIPAITPSHVSSLLNLNLEPQLALGFFNWIESQKPGFQHNVQSYSSLLSILVRHLNLSGDAKTEKIRISMIKSCDSIDDIRFVLDVLRKMNKDAKFKCKLTLNCYNLILISLTRYLLIDEMKKVYLELLDDKITPNVHTFDTLIHGFCKVGNVMEAESCLSKLLQVGFNPNTITYNSLIMGHCRNKIREVSGRNVEALNLFKEMREKGCEPNAHTYTVLIPSMCEDDKLDEARSMVRGMLEKGLVPNMFMYNALIDGFCKAGNVAEAELYLSRMFKAGLSPNEFTYTSLIVGYCGNNDVDSGYRIFQIMPQKNETLYAIIVHGLCKAAQVDLALKLFKEMVEKGYQPNFNTYSLIIYGMCKENKLHEARRMLDEMLRKGLVPDEVMYNDLIHGYCEEGLLEDAFGILDLMVSNCCYPNSLTYKVLMCGFCRNRNMHKLMEVLNKMLEHKLSPILMTCTMFIIDEQRKASCLDNAFRLLNLMTGNGLIPDQWSWDILIRTLCKQGMVEEAHTLFDYIAEKRKREENEAIYTVLIEGYCKLRKIDEALSLFEKMLMEECLPDTETYSVLIDGLCKDGKMHEASLLIEKMLKNSVKATAGKMVFMQFEMSPQLIMPMCGRYWNLKLF